MKMRAALGMATSGLKTRCIRAANPLLTDVIDKHTSFALAVAVRWHGAAK